MRRAAIVDVAGARAAWEEANPTTGRCASSTACAAPPPTAPRRCSRRSAREARELFAAPHRGKARLLDPAEEVDARALVVLLRALDDLAELAATAPHRVADAEELLAALGELEVSLGEPPRAGAVLVADPLSIRARRFDTVIVCGLQEGEFPRPAVAEPFLSDDQRRELATATGLFLAPREDALAAERYLFYAAASRPLRRLVLSCRDADEEGNPAIRSFFVADVQALLTELPEVHRPLSDAHLAARRRAHRDRAGSRRGARGAARDAGAARLARPRGVRGAAPARGAVGRLAGDVRALSRALADREGAGAGALRARPGGDGARELHPPRAGAGARRARMAADAGRADRRRDARRADRRGGGAALRARPRRRRAGGCGARDRQRRAAAAGARGARRRRVPSRRAGAALRDGGGHAAGARARATTARSACAA